MTLIGCCCHSRGARYRRPMLRPAAPMKTGSSWSCPSFRRTSLLTPGHSSLAARLSSWRDRRCSGWMLQRVLLSAGSLLSLGAEQAIFSRV